MTWERGAERHEAAHAAAVAGRLDEAFRLCRLALSDLRAAVGRRHPDYGNTILLLGRLYELSGSEAALPTLRRAAAMLARSIPALVVDSQLALARCFQGLGRYREGLRPARIALRAARTALQRAEAHNQLGVLCKFTGRFAEAEAHYAKALPIYRKSFGARSREMAALLHNLGGLDHARDEFRRGERYARKSVVIARQLLAPGDPERLAHEVAHAALLDGLDRQRESIPIYQRAVRGFTKALGADHYEVASTLHNLASAEHALGRQAAAERHYRQAEKLLATHPVDQALTRYNLGLLLDDRRLLRKALAAFRKHLGAGHPHTRACSEALQ